jgi:diguanylate cyclase (GGDEF)-like protein
VLVHLTTFEALYAIGRTGIALLCVAVAVGSLMRLAALRAAGPPLPGTPPARPLLPAASATLLLLAAALSVNDAWQNVVLHPDQPIAATSWAWLVFDLLVPLLGILLLRALMERDAALDRLARQAVTDPLTGLRNRRGFMAEAATALARCERAGQEAAVIMIDLDRFKSINDVHGHAAGDAVLRAAAAAVRAELRAGDLPGRLGGEEFALLLPDADLDAARATAERLRAALTAAVPHPGGARVTASFGVAPVRHGLEVALGVADSALYQAKLGGRDRVEVARHGVQMLEGAAP